MENWKDIEELLKTKGMEPFSQTIKGESALLKKWLGSGKKNIDVDTSLDIDFLKNPIKRESVFCEEEGDESLFELYKTPSGKSFVINKYTSCGSGQSDAISIIWVIQK